MFVPIVRRWKGGWCQHHKHPTFQEIVDMSEKTDDQVISSSLSTAFFGVNEEDLLDKWLANNSQGQRNEE